LSLQYHVKKDETIYVYSGLLKVGLEASGVDKEVIPKPGEARRFAPGARHRLEALEDCVIFEASTPELDDVVRLSV
jgi:quercetin dioxygenase-like cupin family protein